jgi:hypothetical protein
MAGNLIEGSINVTVLLAVVFSVIFLLLLLVIGFVIYWRGVPVPAAAMLIFRTILALSAGAFGWIIGGQISLAFNLGVITGNAAGGIALAVLVYLINPPRLLEDRFIDRGGPPDAPPAPVTELRQRPVGGTDNE